MAGRMRIDKNSIELGVLIFLFGHVSILAPVGGKIALDIARHFLKKWWEEGEPYVLPETDPALVRQSIYKLKRNKYIEWKVDRRLKRAVIQLTAKGKEAFARINFSNITISRPKDWDRKWRFILFDFPEKQRSLRDIFRAKLKELGFFQFQKSVWIFPFECEKEIRYICEYLEVAHCVMMFSAKIDNDRTLRRYFLREGILLRRDLSLFDKGMRY